MVEDSRRVTRLTEQLGRVTTEDGRISSGRIQALNLATVDITDSFNRVELTAAEEKYYDTMAMFPEAFGKHEVCLVGAGVGSGIQNTMELHTMKYDEAMSGPDKKKWEDAVEDEYNHMKKAKVFEVVPEQEVPEDATILSSTWVMKKKANSIYRARVTARGFEQIDGEHYDEDDKAAPVVSDITIRVMLVIMIMAGFTGHIMDVKGAFLLGEYDPKQKMYLEILKGSNASCPRTSCCCSCTRCMELSKQHWPSGNLWW